MMKTNLRTIREEWREDRVRVLLDEAEHAVPDYFASKFAAHLEEIAREVEGEKQHYEKDSLYDEGLSKAASVIRNSVEK